MQLVVLGLNHKTAPVSVRECFSFSPEKIKDTLTHLTDYEEINECVILSTCNRTEMYAAVSDANQALPVMQDIFERMAVNGLDGTDYLFSYIDNVCIRHLFEVSSSLDSLIIGEGQILSQVKQAYAIARGAGATSTVLNTLFNRAIAVGKKVRTETYIAFNTVSVSYAAVELAKTVFTDLNDTSVLVMGAGKMSELTLQHLVSGGVKKVTVTNRSYERAEELAAKFNGSAVPFNDYLSAAAEADIVITSTGAPHYVIKAWDVAHLMTKRQGRPLVFIDIAVPRDVEPQVADVAGVKLYNIDQLEKVVAINKQEREQEAKQAQEIIEEELKELVSKFQYLSYRPILARLSNKAERIRLRELKRAMTKLTELTPEERKVVEHMSRMLIRKILRDPILKIHETAGTDKQEAYLEAVRRLFKLEEMGDEPICETKTNNRYAGQ